MFPSFYRHILNYAFIIFLSTKVYYYCTDYGLCSKIKKEYLVYQMFFKVKNILCQCDFEEKGNLS